ncbi:MAG: vWA domain-containing protein, partial [Aggregatilineales bacterium]
MILAFDVSGSMAADDLKPTRMDAAKAAAQDFVQRQPVTVQIGAVAFSDN